MGSAEDLGVVGRFKFEASISEGYTPGQQNLIERHLVERGYFHRAPDGYLSVYGIAQSLGTINHTVSAACEALGEKLGLVQTYKSRRRLTAHYSPEQQELIRQLLEERGSLAAPAPSGYAPIGKMAKEWGIAHSAVDAAKNAVEVEVGETRKYRFGGTFTAGYSEEQQQLIRRQLEKQGQFSGAPPDGYLSIRGLAKLLRVSDKTITKVIEDVSEELGEIQQFKFRSKAAKGLSPKQQALINDYISSQKNETR